MRSLRVSLATASLLLVSASTLSAQATRIACKDGSEPKIGHFTCWGHGGVVSVPAKKARAMEKKSAAAKPAAKKKSAAKKPATPVAKKKAAVKARSARTAARSSK